MLKKCAVLLTLLNCLVFGYFEDIDDLDGYSEGSVAYLSWTLNLTGQTIPGGASAFLYQIQQSLDGTFEDVNLRTWTKQMSYGSEWVEDETVGGLQEGNWRFRLRVMAKGVDLTPVTGWSNVCLVVIEEGLGTPTLNLHILSTIVSTPTISMSIGGDSKASFDLLYGRNPNLMVGSEVEFEDRNINRLLHTVTLAGVFDADDRVFFMVRATYQGMETYSLVHDITYRPDTKYTYYLPHVVNNEFHSTSIYFRYPGTIPTLVGFTALTGDGMWGTGSPQTLYNFFEAESKLHFTTVELFGLPINQKPIIVVSDQPIILEAIYTSDMGTRNIATVPAVTSANRDMTIDGIFGGGNSYPGASISNVSEQPCTVTCYFVWVSNLTPDPAQRSTGIYSFQLKAYKSHVFAFDDVFSELWGENYVGTLHVTATAPIVGVGSVANDHGSFRTIDFVNQSEK